MGYYEAQNQTLEKLRRGRVADQAKSMQAAATGRTPIRLNDARWGLPVPGGDAYGSRLNGRQVLVQKNVGNLGFTANSINFGGQELFRQKRTNADGSVDVLWVPRQSSGSTVIEQRYGIKPAADPVQDRIEDPVVAPGLGAPDPYGDPAARAREAEQRRMMQQYASKEYWDTEQGKAMLSLGQQMSAPKDAKLADYYGAQRAVGIGSMGEILEGLASVDDRYKEGGDLRKWAEANQGLALREYNKRFPGGTAGMGEGELSVPTIDSANPTAGERALMEAKYALHGEPATTPPSSGELASGGYTPDDRVLGINAQGQTTVGEGAYGFDPEFDQLPIAQPPVQPEAARASNLAPATQTAQQQRAEELLQRYKGGVTRGQLLTGI